MMQKAVQVDDVWCLIVIWVGAWTISHVDIQWEQHPGTKHFLAPAAVSL